MPETMPNSEDGLALNRALWDARARVHGSTPTDRFYDVESFLTGRQTLYAIERELAGDVTGKDLLHLHSVSSPSVLPDAASGPTAAVSNSPRVPCSSAAPWHD